MNKNSRCPIWRTPTPRGPADHNDGKLIDSPRVCGRYFITRTAIACLTQLDERGKARLTTWLVKQRRLGVECPEIDSNTITMAEQQKDLSIHDRADRLLQYIRDQAVDIGFKFYFKDADVSSTGIAAWSESVRPEEVRYLLEYLIEQN